MGEEEIKTPLLVSDHVCRKLKTIYTLLLETKQGI